MTTLKDEMYAVAIPVVGVKILLAAAAATIFFFLGVFSLGATIFFLGVCAACQVNNLYFAISSCCEP